MLAHERVADAAKVDPHVRQLMDEQRPGVEELDAVDLLPLVGRSPGGVALRRQRVRGRAEPEQVEHQRLVVALPAVGQEALLGRPAVAHASLPRSASIASRPCGTAHRRACGSRLPRRVCCSKYAAAASMPASRNAVSTLDSSRSPGAPAALHVEEVIVEALVAGGIGLGPVRRVAQRSAASRASCCTASRAS